MGDLLAITESHLEMCFYVVILYLQGNDIRNKQFSIGFAESKLKERCGISPASNRSELSETDPGPAGKEGPDR